MHSNLNNAQHIPGRYDDDVPVVGTPTNFASHTDCKVIIRKIVTMTKEKLFCENAIV